MSELFKDQEEHKKKGPVFDVSRSMNAEVEEEQERRRRRQEEQRKWIENDPNRLNKSQTYKGSQRLLPDEEAAKKELKKDYFKITEPVVAWEEAKYPQMPDELHKLMKDILNDNKRMTKSHFGKVKDAVQDLAKADSDELKGYFINRLIIAASDYLDTSTKKTSEHRIRNCTRLISQLRNYKRTVLTEQERIERKNAGKDKEAREIIRYKTALEALKSDTIMPYPGTENEAKLNTYVDEINGMGMIFAMQYNKYISACDVYLSKKNKPQDGRRYIEKLRTKAEKELKIFNNALTEFLSENRTKKDITWGEAIERRTNNRIELDTKKTGNSGADTSDVYKLKRGSSSFAYFKKEENLGESIPDCWRNIFNKYSGAKISSEARRVLDRLNDALIKDFAKMSKVSDPLKKDKAERAFYDDFCRRAIQNKNFYKRMADPNNELMEELVSEKKYECWETIRGIGTIEPELVSFVCNVMKEFVKKTNAFSIATRVANIKAGSNLSGRNVATYRMAVALGIDSSVARSETAEITMNGRAVFGNLMDEAKGKDAFAARRNGIKYSGKAACDLATMHIFDLICGQVDRHTSNYYVESEQGLISTVKMIDNDMAFGLLDTASMEKGKQVLPGFTMQAIAAMPEVVKKRIREMDKKTLEILLEDILSAEEIEAAYKRLEFIKRKIIEFEDECATKRKSADKSVRYEQYCMRFEEYRGLKYQYDMLEAAGQQKNAQEQQKAMEKVSYLQIPNMEDKDTLMTRMQEFKEIHEKDKWDA